MSGCFVSLWVCQGVLSVCGCGGSGWGVIGWIGKLVCGCMSGCVPECVCERGWVGVGCLWGGGVMFVGWGWIFEGWDWMFEGWGWDVWGWGWDVCGVEVGCLWGGGGMFEEWGWDVCGVGVGCLSVGAVNQVWELGCLCGATPLKTHPSSGWILSAWSQLSHGAYSASSSGQKPAVRAKAPMGSPMHVQTQELPTCFLKHWNLKTRHCTWCLYLVCNHIYIYVFIWEWLFTRMFICCCCN